MPISKLELHNVGPFADIEFHFHDQINMLTGPNNTGKSTVLWALGELLVYPFTMPERLLKKAFSEWSLNISINNNALNRSGKFPIAANDLLDIYKSLGYTCFIPAHRHATNFRSKGPTITSQLDSQIDQEIELITQAKPSLLKGNTRESLRASIVAWTEDEDPELQRRRKLMLTGALLVSDAFLIQKIVDLDYAAYRLRRPEMRAIIDKIASIASDITEGFPLEFLDIAQDERGLFPNVRTLNGELPIDALSQGTMSIIHCLAYLLIGYAEYYDYPPDLEKKPGIIIIDEIDAHLHPSWQRRIIPSLTRNFPNLQIFCSTHSPLMLAGLNAGQVQLLRQNPEGRVTVSTNDSDIVGWTSDEILRHLLELASPTDLATAERVRRLQELRRTGNLTAEQREQLEVLRLSIGNELLSGPMGAEVARFAGELRRIHSQQSGKETDESSNTTSVPG